MKLASKLPKRNGLDESRLPVALIRSPRVRRTLIVEVVTDKVETIYDEAEDTEYEVPTARVVSAEFVDDPHDISLVLALASRAKQRRTGQRGLPGLDLFGDLLHDHADAMASSLPSGSSMTIQTTDGRTTEVVGTGRVDPETGEILDDEDDDDVE